MQVVILSKSHNRDGFDCGNADLNRFLKTQARQDAERDFSRTYVAVEDEDPVQILGFSTLSAGQVAFDDVETSILKKLPRYPMPVVHLGRLAVSLNHQGKGVGKALLKDAISRTVETADSMGVHALQVTAKDETAAAFYEKYGFIRLKPGTDQLYFPVSALRAGYAEAAKRVP
jgi:GNAT superfamily N-acetyltransferase